jgi:hypothetical protein
VLPEIKVNNNRQVGYKVLLNLLKSKGIGPYVGFFLVFFSVFVIFPITFTLNRVLTEPYGRYDFAGINKYGTEKTAKITSIESVKNISINYEHPSIISYAYDDNGQSTADKFETLDLDKINGFTVGTEVKILAYQGQSIIKGLVPFSFPFYLFYILPAVFLIVGLPLLLLGLIPALKIFNLYKTGILKEAYIVSINSQGGMMLPISSFKQNLLVNYFFYNEFGGQVFGESLTNDFLILTNKKAGDPIDIFVSEENEDKSCLVPKLEAMKYNWSV